MTATNQDLIGRVLNLYYVDELTQAEVGRRLGLSTAKVNRLLQQARQQGMVEITIRTPCSTSLSWNTAGRLSLTFRR